jgi:hypothetical protein
MGSTNDIIISIPVHMTWELEHFLPKVVGRGCLLEASGHVVFDTFPRLLVGLESLL